MYSLRRPQIQNASLKYWSRLRENNLFPQPTPTSDQPRTRDSEESYPPRPLWLNHLDNAVQGAKERKA